MWFWALLAAFGSAVSLSALIDEDDGDDDDDGSSPTGNGAEPKSDLRCVSRRASFGCCDEAETLAQSHKTTHMTPLLTIHHTLQMPIIEIRFPFSSVYATLPYCFDCQDLPFRRKTMVWNFKAGEFHSR